MSLHPPTDAHQNKVNPLHQRNAATNGNHFQHCGLEIGRVEACLCEEILPNTFGHAESCSTLRLLVHAKRASRQAWARTVSSSSNSLSNAAKLGTPCQLARMLDRPKTTRSRMPRSTYSDKTHYALLIKEHAVAWSDMRCWMRPHLSVHPDNVPLIWSNNPECHFDADANTDAPLLEGRRSKHLEFQMSFRTSVGAKPYHRGSSAGAQRCLAIVRKLPKHSRRKYALPHECLQDAFETTTRIPARKVRNRDSRQR